MSPGELIALSTAWAAVTGLAPLLLLLYRGSPITSIRAVGIAVAAVVGYIWALLAAQWNLFWTRYTYLLGLGLLTMSLALAYVGIGRRRWSYYIPAAGALAYILLLAVLARAMGLPDPFPL